MNLIRSLAHSHLSRLRGPEAPLCSCSLVERELSSGSCTSCSSQPTCMICDGGYIIRSPDNQYALVACSSLCFSPCFSSRVHWCRILFRLITANSSSNSCRPNVGLDVADSQDQKLCSSLFAYFVAGKVVVRLLYGITSPAASHSFFAYSPNTSTRALGRKLVGCGVGELDFFSQDLESIGTVSSWTARTYDSLKTNEASALPGTTFLACWPIAQDHTLCR